jgi:hypothetical protein
MRPASDCIVAGGERLQSEIAAGSKRLQLGITAGGEQLLLGIEASGGCPRRAESIRDQLLDSATW